MTIAAAIHSPALGRPANRLAITAGANAVPRPARADGHRPAGEVSPPAKVPAGASARAVASDPTAPERGAAPKQIRVWAGLQPYAARLDGHLAACRRQARLAAVLLVEVAVTNNDTARDLMQTLGQRLSHRVRATDEVVQIGADQFSVLLRDAGDRASGLVRDRLDKLLRGPYRVGADLVEPLMRIGRAVQGLDGQHAADLLQAAHGPKRVHSLPQP